MASVTSKSAITPSLSGLIATMSPGVLPNALGIVANGKNNVSALFDSHNGGLSQHNALILNVDQCVGSAKVDPDVTGQKAENFTEHEV